MIFLLSRWTKAFKQKYTVLNRKHKSKYREFVQQDGDTSPEKYVHSPQMHVLNKLFYVHSTYQLKFRLNDIRPTLPNLIVLAKKTFL